MNNTEKKQMVGQIMAGLMQNAHQEGLTNATSLEGLLIDLEGESLDLLPVAIAIVQKIDELDL